MVFSIIKKLFSSEAPKDAADTEVKQAEAAVVEPSGAEEQECGCCECKHEEVGHGRHGKHRGANGKTTPVQHLTSEEEEKLIERLQELVRYIATSLVDEPDQLSTELTEKDGSRVIMISCEKKDAGKLIGRNGRIIAAIRILVSGTAAKSGLKVTVDIVD